MTEIYLESFLGNKTHSQKENISINEASILEICFGQLKAAISQIADFKYGEMSP